MHGIPISFEPVRPTAVRRPRSAVALAAVGALVLAGLPARASTWDHFHGDAANSGFADVPTLPANRASAIVPNIGTYGPGAGPVIGPDGTVYLGDEGGVLRAFHADGSFYWQRTLGESIKASPVVDTDGSIYVVGIGTYLDHRVNPAVTRFTSTLYRFVPGGGLLGVTPFPYHTGKSSVVTTAPPNIWRSGSDAAIIIPAVYQGDYSDDLRLLAFSTTGVLLGDAIVTTLTGEVTSSSILDELCFLCGFDVAVVEEVPQDPFDRLPPDTAPPLSGVALFTYAGGGAPWVIVSDQVHDTVGYTFALAGGFTEWFRKHDQGLWKASPAMALKDGHTVIGKAKMSEADPAVFYGRITFAGPNATPWPDVSTPLVVATPARTGDGRIVVVHNLGFDVLKNGTVQHVEFPSQTMAPAAISRGHVFVSTAGAFHTYDVATMNEVATYFWVGGGLSSPAIGPGGEVYALASNTLFVWPAPLLLCGFCNGSGGGATFQP